ncbi:MAG: hypothetical protein ACI8UP_002706 [Porticoccaceae bacterium]
MDLEMKVDTPLQATADGGFRGFCNIWRQNP